MAYNAYVLIDKNNRLSFLDILKELKKYSINTITSNQGCINIENYKFMLTFNEESYVEEEAKDLLHGHKDVLVKSNFVPDNTRLEIHGEDDPNMDYFNDFLHIISKLAEHPSLLVYEQAGEEFI